MKNDNEQLTSLPGLEGEVRYEAERWKTKKFTDSDLLDAIEKYKAEMKILPGGVCYCYFERYGVAGSGENARQAVASAIRKLASRVQEMAAVPGWQDIFR